MSENNKIRKNKGHLKLDAVQHDMRMFVKKNVCEILKP